MPENQGAQWAQETTQIPPHDVSLQVSPALWSYPVGGLEAPIVGDVLPEGVFAIDCLTIDSVVAILLYHACCLMLEGLH